MSPEFEAALTNLIQEATSLLDWSHVYIISFLILVLLGSSKGK